MIILKAGKRGYKCGKAARIGGKASSRRAVAVKITARSYP